MVGSLGGVDVGFVGRPQAVDKPVADLVSQNLLLFFCPFFFIPFTLKDFQTFDACGKDG